MSGDIARYKLTPQENKRIFREEIVPEILEGPQPQEKPTALFLISQPGSGKSRLQKHVEEELNTQGGYIDIDSDLYKPYHPDYEDLMEQDDKLMAAAIGPDGREWLRRATEYARGADQPDEQDSRRFNVIVQNTAQSPEHSIALMQDYRNSGYRIDAVVMAVPKEISDQGIQYRYFRQVAERGAGRLTVQAKADLSYTGVEELARLIDERHLTDRVRLFRRSETAPCYDTADRRLSASSSLTEPLVREREQRPWTPDMVENFEAVQKEMRQVTRPEVLEGLPAEQQAKLHRLGPDWAQTLADLEQRAAPKIAAARDALGGIAAANEALRHQHRSASHRPERSGESPDAALRPGPDDRGRERGMER